MKGSSCLKGLDPFRIGATMTIDKTILRETRYIALWVLILSALMESVFLIGGWWDYTVLLGNLLGAFFATLNFFLMGLSVQKAIGKEDEKEQKTVMRVSMLYRNFMLIAVAAVGALVPVFNLYATLIPLLFPRITIALRPLFKK